MNSQKHVQDAHRAQPPQGTTAAFDMFDNMGLPGNMGDSARAETVMVKKTATGKKDMFDFLAELDKM